MIKRAFIASFTPEFFDPIKKFYDRSVWYSGFTNLDETSRNIGLSYNLNWLFKVNDMLTKTANSPVYSVKQ